MTCINCGNEHSYPFCPKCGEKAGTPKITFKSIIDDSFQKITNMDKGFLFTVKKLLLNPKGTVEGYIQGQRKHIFNPISFLILAISIYLITDSFMETSREFEKVPSKIYSVGYEAGRFIKLYGKYFWILSIIWLSFSTKLVFRKYNLAEHIAVNAFIIGQSTLLGIIVLLITKTGVLFNPIVYISIMWLLYRIYLNDKKDNQLGSFLQSLTATMLFFFQLVIIVVLIGILRS